MAGRIERGTVVAAALVLSVACSNKAEGVLLVITADPGVKIDTLQVGVGSAMEDVTFVVGDGNYEHVHDVLGDGFVTVGSRDISADPYRYFISGGGELNLDVAVAGFKHIDDQQIDVFAATIKGITREPGVVHEYNLHLEQGELKHKEDSCTRVFRAGGGDIFLTSNTDYDCDGYEEDGPVGERDCFPFNGNYHPGAEDRCEFFGEGIDNNCNGSCDEHEPGAENGVSACGTNVDSVGDNFQCTYSCPDEPPNGRRPGEICDGFDTDCNPNTLPHNDLTGCFVAGDGDSCFFGSTPCSDGGGDGTENPAMCSAEENAEFAVPAEFCDAYASEECGNSNQALDCAYEKGPEVKTLRCALPVAPGNNAICPLKIPVFADRGEDSCRLQILDPRVLPFATPRFEAASNRCDASYIDFVGNNEGEPSSFELLLKQAVDGEAPRFTRLIVNTYFVDACDDDGEMVASCDGPGLSF